MSIIDRLITLRSSMDYETAIAAIREELTHSEELEDELQEKYDELLFQDPSKVDEVSSKLRERQAHNEKLRRALKGADERRQAAIAIEKKAAIEKEHASVVKHQKRLLAVCNEFHEHAESIARLTVEGRQLEDAISEFNRMVSAAQRHDLEIQQPIMMAQAFTGSRQLSYPWRQAIQLFEYLPHQHPDGAGLAFVSKVKL